MLHPRLALAGLAVTVALTGCGQVSEASDSTGSAPGDRPTAEPTVIRSPYAVPETEGPTG